MSARILTLPDDEEFLRKKAEPVTDFNAHRALVDKMQFAMTGTGVGLAAPQVGESFRIIMIDEGIPDKVKVMYNPVITAQGKTMIGRNESCLSIPGQKGMVSRHSWVEVKYQDKKGKEHVELFSTFNARIVQHEIDHLDGVLFVDRIGKVAVSWPW